MERAFPAHLVSFRQRFLRVAAMTASGQKRRDRSRRHVHPCPQYPQYRLYIQYVGTGSDVT